MSRELRTQSALLMWQWWWLLLWKLARDLLVLIILISLSLNNNWYFQINCFQCWERTQVFVLSPSLIYFLRQILANLPRLCSNLQSPCLSLSECRHYRHVLPYLALRFLSVLPCLVPCHQWHHQWSLFLSQRASAPVTEEEMEALRVSGLSKVAELVGARKKGKSWTPWIWR